MSSDMRSVADLKMLQNGDRNIQTQHREEQHEEH